VVHLAFPTQGAARRERPFETLRSVLLGTSNVLRLAVECGASQVVLASSGKVYGPLGALPISEDHSVVPQTRLGGLKRLAESVLHDGARALGGADGLSVTTLRIFNVYGPGQRTEFVVPHLVSALRTGGSLRLGELDHRRDFVHLDDTCRAFEAALAQPAPAGVLRALNVGTGKSVTVRELVERLGRLAGVTPEVVQEPSRRRPQEATEERADVSRLTALGWTPRVALSEGLAALWEGRSVQS
jgi:GDP-4-dehydro-6-deoxy-D-mannose reductase